MWRRFRKNRLALAGLAIIGALILVALAAPIVAPHDPGTTYYRFLAPPDQNHWLGTDDVGRDLLSRLIYASRVSLSVGMGTSLTAITIGVIIGALAGYYGKRVDSLLSALVDIMLSLPIIPLALVLAAFLQVTPLLLTAVIGGLSWMMVARLTRAEFLSLREREYTRAAIASGAGDFRVIFLHILPNALPPIIVAATLLVATGILLESVLSYLGYGIQPPTPSWGNMLQNAQRYLRIAPRVAFFPGLLISLTVVSINFVGDGLRDALDPRLRI